LQKQAALLDAKPEVDLVAGPVRQLTASPLNNTWATTSDAKARPTRPAVDAQPASERCAASAHTSHAQLSSCAASFCDAQVLRLVTGRNGPLPRQLYLSDFGRITKGRFAIANPPHNAPMFRHARVQACAQVSMRLTR
jgi:hypothetical protein